MEEDNIYVLNDDFLQSDDQLLTIQDDFSPRKRKHIYTLDGFQEEDAILIEDHETVDDILMLPKRPREEREPFSPIKSSITPLVEPGPSNALPIFKSEELTVPVDIESVITPDIANDDAYLVEHIDIQTPISALRTILEKKLNMNLQDYEFWLQNAKPLNANKNLVDQCIQGEGLVQINMEIFESEKRISIADVLKPTEEFLNSYHKEKNAKKANNNSHWMVDNNFRKEMARLEIPEDPRKWSKEQVRMWFIWAVRQFNIPGVKLNDWTMSGKELCEMTQERFREICPKDRGEFFWTHLELLRRCGILAIIAKTDEKIAIADVEEPTVQAVAATPVTPVAVQHDQSTRNAPKKSRILGSNTVVTERRSGFSGSKLGNNGQIQLWQFLLELLTDKAHRNVIYWLSDDGEFKLEDPEMVATLWGARKNKPAMTYEKLSRALRYYYDGDMIAKVHGKRFVYKFVCDLKELMGYSAADLNRLVTECAKKHGIGSPSGDIEYYS